LSAPHCPYFRAAAYEHCRTGAAADTGESDLTWHRPRRWRGQSLTFLLLKITRLRNTNQLVFLRLAAKAPTRPSLDSNQDTCSVSTWE
jgi:hypothetical protein